LVFQLSNAELKSSVPPGRGCVPKVACCRNCVLAVATDALMKALTPHPGHAPFTFEQGAVESLYFGVGSVIAIVMPANEGSTEMAASAVVAAQRLARLRSLKIIREL
jgi:hypothetical protein